jgi:tuberous sclerosis protein 2
VAIDPSFFALQLSPYGRNAGLRRSKVVDTSGLPALFRLLDRIPVIDTHKVGIMYVALGQTHEREILGNNHGSPAYTRFLEGIGRLINLRGQVDVYAGGLDPDEDGEYAYAWWDDIGQILYHTATLMPNHPHEPQFDNKKRHIGNDFVRIIWNDSGMPYRFDTLTTQFQFVNIVIEPHSPLGAIAAFSSSSPSTPGPSNSSPGGPGSQPQHENEYFRVTVQRAPGMTEFTPIGNFKLISAENLPLLVRQLSLLADWFASVFQNTQGDTVQVEVQTNWRARLQAIKRFRAQMPPHPSLAEQPEDGGEESSRDFTVEY